MNAKKKKLLANELNRAHMLAVRATQSVKGGNAVHVLALEKAVEELFKNVRDEAELYAELLPQVEGLQAVLRNLSIGLERRKNIKLVVA